MDLHAHAYETWVKGAESQALNSTRCALRTERP